MLRIWKLLLCACWLPISAQTAAAKKQGRSVTFLKTQVDFNKSYLDDHQVTVNPDNASLYIVLNIPEDFTSDIWAAISIAIKNPKANTYRTLFTYDINVCQIMGRETNDFDLLQMWLQNFMKYGTLPKKCPIKKGQYFWHDLRIEKKSLPAFLAKGKYRGCVNTYFRQSKKMQARDSLANVTVFGDIK